MRTSTNGLPAKVAAFCARNAPTIPANVTGAALEQEGTIRLGPEKPWMPFRATQTFSATETAFRWRARFSIGRLARGVVEDALEDGVGRLDARLWGVLPVAHARGPEIDRGEAQRYLAELVWCPAAMTRNAELRFDPIADDTVRVWLGDPETYVDWRFDRHGDIVGIRTETRVHDGVVRPWEGRFSDYRDFGDFRAPAGGEVWWELPDGPFVYWRGAITGASWTTSADPHRDADPLVTAPASGNTKRH